MLKINIKLDTVDKVKEFVKEVTTMECGADLVNGKYRVDAKSILGIFSLDLTKVMVLELGCDEDDEEKYKAAMARFTVD